jgi:hypothetical protein
MSLVRANWPVGFQVEVKGLSSIKEYQPGPQIPPSIWLSIGLPSRGIRLHDLVREGLPFEVLELIARYPNVASGYLQGYLCATHNVGA